MYYYEDLKSRNTGLTYGGTDQNYRQAWNVHDNSLEIDMVQINSHSCVIWGNTWQEMTRSMPSTRAGNNIITRITQPTLNFSAQHLQSTDQQEKHLQTNSDTLKCHTSYMLILQAPQRQETSLPNRHSDRACLGTAPSKLCDQNLPSCLRELFN